MPLPCPPQCYRCRSCGMVLPARYAVPGEPDAPLLLHHVGQAHPEDVGRYLDQMQTTDDVARVIVQAYEVVVEET